MKWIRKYGFWALQIAVVALVFRTSVHEWAVSHEEPLHCDAHSEQHLHEAGGAECEVCKVIVQSHLTPPAFSCESLPAHLTHVKRTQTEFVLSELKFALAPRGPPAAQRHRIS